MRLLITILTFLTLIGCNNNGEKSVSENDRLELVPEPDKDLREKYEQQEKDSLKGDTVLEEGLGEKAEQPSRGKQFKYDKLNKFEFPDNLGDLDWLEEKDELESYLGDYRTPGGVALFSNQGNITSGINIFTIVNDFEVCDQQITLITTDSISQVIAAVRLATNGGCDLPEQSHSVFSNDSTFTRISFPDLGYTMLDSADQIGEEYLKITDTFIISHNGQIKMTSTKTDTLLIK